MSSSVRGARLAAWIVAVLGVLAVVPHPVFGYTVVRTDGTAFEAQAAPVFAGDKAIVTLPGGSQVTMPARDIDRAATETVNKQPDVPPARAVTNGDLHPPAAAPSAFGNGDLLSEARYQQELNAFRSRRVVLKDRIREIRGDLQAFGLLPPPVTSAHLSFRSERERSLAAATKELAELKDEARAWCLLHWEDAHDSELDEYRGRSEPLYEDAPLTTDDIANSEKLDQAKAMLAGERDSEIAQFDPPDGPDTSVVEQRRSALLKDWAPDLVNTPEERKRSAASRQETPVNAAEVPKSNGGTTLPAVGSLGTGTTLTVHSKGSAWRRASYESRLSVAEEAGKRLGKDSAYAIALEHCISEATAGGAGDGLEVAFLAATCVTLTDAN